MRLMKKKLRAALPILILFLLLSAAHSEETPAAHSAPWFFRIWPGFGAVRHVPGTYFISTRGSDSNDGSAEKPWKTLRHSVWRLKAGDVLTVMPGRYPGEWGIRFAASGNRKAWITVQSSGPALFEGSGGFSRRAFIDTAGQSYLRFRNLSFARVGIALHIRKSSHIEIEGIQASHSAYAVRLTDASAVNVRDSGSFACRNGFRGEGQTRDALFERIGAFRSRDDYPGYNKNYLNGDGFIFEDATRRITIRNSVSAEHWDTGFDIKGDDFILESIVAYGNKNGMKLWGDRIQVADALIYRQKRQILADGNHMDGNGLNARSGSARIIRSAFAHNGDWEIKVAKRASVVLEKSRLSHDAEEGGHLFQEGRFRAVDVRAFEKGRPVKLVAVTPED